MAQTQSLIRKPILRAVTAAFALTILSFMLHVIAEQECQLFHNLIWVALQLLHPATLAAKTLVSSHPCEASTLLHQLLQIVASNRPPPPSNAWLKKKSWFMSISSVLARRQNRGQHSQSRLCQSPPQPKKEI